VAGSSSVGTALQYLPRKTALAVPFVSCSVSRAGQAGQQREITYIPTESAVCITESTIKAGTCLLPHFDKRSCV